MTPIRILPMILASALGALGAGTASAQAITCGETYVVQRGDFLTQIADRAYGVPTYYQLIYGANRMVIGGNPNVLELGQELEIPCLDGSTAPVVAETSTFQSEETTDRLPLANSRQIRFVTATDWAPYLDRDQEQGGMFIELVNAAMSQVTDSPDAYKIDWINDWSSHLEPLLSDVAYDMGIAWYRPDCSKIDKLAAGSVFRCNNLDWSEPLFEQIVSYYTRADYPVPATHADLFGANVCRPAGYSNFMLEEFDLVEPNITFSTPTSPSNCIEGLLDGTYDVAVLAVEVAEDALAPLGASDLVTRHEALDYVATLNVVTSKNNPDGADQLALLDAGLREIKTNGDWFQIVRRHLAEFRRAN